MEAASFLSATKGEKLKDSPQWLTWFAKVQLYAVYWGSTGSWRGSGRLLAGSVVDEVRSGLQRSHTLVMEAASFLSATKGEKLKDSPQWLTWFAKVQLYASE
jgi:hypothetical protein